MAEQNREDILASFQAATGMEDIGTVFSCLEEAGWDLTKALDSFMSKQQELATPQAPPTTLSAPPGVSKPPVSTSADEFNSSYKVYIQVAFEKQSHIFQVYSSKVISDFKTQVSVMFNIPSTHLHLSGWPSIVNDEMILADITRPRAKTMNLTAERISDESRVVSLQLTYPPDCVVEFQFPVKNTILELKQHVAQAEMSGIPVKDQTWSGLPIGTTDYTVIRNSNFKNPIHQLVVNRKFAVAESTVSNSNASKSMESAIDNQSSPEPIEDAYYGSDSDSDSEPDIDLIDDMDDIPQDNFKDPMIPEHCDDQSKALVLFSENFERRYGPTHPVFFCGSMERVIFQSTQGNLLDRRPVAVYLHHDRSISSNIFCEKILCSKPISDFLTNNYLTWAWDMTMPTNTTRFLDSVKMLFGDEIRRQLGGLGPSKYPLLLIFQKKPNSPLEIANILTIDTKHDEALSSLAAGYEEHLAAIEELQFANEARWQREQIKQEQDVAYKESAEKDKQTYNNWKQSELNRVRSQEAKLQRLAFQDIALKELPDEPEKAEGVTSIRFRFPSGDVTNRRFLGSDRIGLLYTYAESKGFPPGCHRLVLNFPKKNLGEYPSNKNLVECGLSPQAMVFVEEHVGSS